MRTDSPLRYPGGKGVLFERLRRLIYANQFQGGVYVEPFAGGAAVALALMFREHVDKIVINDFDYRVFAFWDSVTRQTRRFVKKIENVPLTVDEWDKQRKIYLNPDRHSRLAVGFSAFYLNRCNRSGIMVNGGPIGGRDQTGNYKIDARFNRDSLIDRVERIAEQTHRIVLKNMDAIDLLRWAQTTYSSEQAFVYLDPPYYDKGAGLYYNSFEPDDHARLAEFLKDEFKLPWVLTYDDVPEIGDLYDWAEQRKYMLRYSAFESRKGSELLITADWVNTSAFEQFAAA